MRKTTDVLAQLAEASDTKSDSCGFDSR